MQKYNSKKLLCSILEIFLHYQQLRTNITMQPMFDISFKEHRLILDKIIEKDSCGAEQTMKDHLLKAKDLWISRK